MSLRYEQYRALHRTRRLLSDILTRTHTSWTAKELKTAASLCRRHFPTLKPNGEPMFSQDGFECPEIEPMNETEQGEK